MTIKEKMRDAGYNNKTVKIVDIDGIEYIGVADSYHTAADEERGIPTVCIDTKDKGNWGLYEDEIVSIEEV